MNPAFNKAIRLHLLGDVVLAAAINGQIFSDVAADGATYPYILMTVNASDDLNRMQLDETETVFNIQVVADGDTVGGTGKAAEIEALVRGRLHRAALMMDAPWVFQRIERQTSYRMVEYVAGRKIMLAGGLYRLRADKAD